MGRRVEQEEERRRRGGVERGGEGGESVFDNTQ